MGLVLTGDSQTVRQVTAFGSDQCGIIALGATHLLLDHPSVLATGNTGIDITQGTSGTASGYVTILSPTIYNSGDDGIAVETYVGSPSAHDVWIDHAQYTNTGTPTPGHGIAVVGGTNVTVTNFSITGSPASGIYVADGQVWNDAGSSNVIFNSGTIANANTWASPPSGQSAIQNGAALVWSNSSTEQIDHVLMENIWIVNTNPAANYQVGDFATPTSSRVPTNVEFRNLLFLGNLTNLFKAGSTPSTDYWELNWQLFNADGSLTELLYNVPGPLPFTS